MPLISPLMPVVNYKLVRYNWDSGSMCNILEFMHTDFANYVQIIHNCFLQTI